MSAQAAELEQLPGADEGDSGEGPRVYILARKVLLRNTRIFKQADSLTRAGYQVTAIGILPPGGEALERKDGYLILRVALDPIYVRLPRRLRRAGLRAERAILRLPSRFIRLLMRVRRRRRLLVARLRRRVRVARFGLRRRLRLAAFVLRRARRRAGRVLIGHLPHTGPGRIILLRLARRWRLARYQIRRPRRALAGAVGAAALVLRELWALLLAPADERQELAIGESRALRWLAVPALVLARTLRLAVSAVRGGWGMLGRLAARHTLAGGVRTSARLLARALRRLENPLIGALSWFLRRFAWPLKSLEYYKVVYRTVTRQLEPPDVIHANDLDTLLIGILLARRYRAALFYDAQELYVGVHTLPGWYRKLLAVQERVLIHRADRVTVVNGAIGEVMERKYRVRIDSVILNCPPLELPDARRAGISIRAQLGLPAQERVLLYSGGLSPRRGIENTLLALEHLEGVSLVILGEGSLRPRLERLAEERGLGGRLFFTDFVPHTDVPAYIGSADLGVIPYENVGINHYLCSPSKLFHYIMAGLPIVCSDFPFLRSVVVEDGLGEVFDPSDPRSIAAAVGRVLPAAGEIRERLRAVQHRYCWEEQELRFLELYRTLPIGRPPIARAKT